MLENSKRHSGKVQYQKFDIVITLWVQFRLIIGFLVSPNYSVEIGNFRFAGNIAILLLEGAFVLGAATFSLAIARNEDAELGMLFSGFKYYGKTLAL